VVGQKAFGHFALFKVARRKAGTLSGRYRSNGYVPQNTECDGFTTAGSDGLPLIDIGEVRDGGSYEQRMGHIAVWNSVMDEHNYLVRRWSDFMRAWV